MRVDDHGPSFFIEPGSAVGMGSGSLNGSLRRVARETQGRFDREKETFRSIDSFGIQCQSPARAPTKCLLKNSIAFGQDNAAACGR
jgi:hypothetical protein